MMVNGTGKPLSIRVTIAGLGRYRSEEHTSELQSRLHLVCRLLLEKKKSNIKYCAITISGLIVLGILYIRLFVNGDDPAGPTALGIFTTFASIVIATAAAIFERLLQ